MEDGGKLPIQTGIKGVSVFALASPKVFKYLRLKRKVEESVSTIVDIPYREEDEESKLDKTGIKKEASKCIKEFETTMNNEGLYLGNLYRNIGPYCIETVKSKDQGKKTPGYDAETKKITVVEGDERSTIFRSLLTCASSGEPFEATGFHQIIYKKDKDGNLEKQYEIGEGLNVAYTEILLERYFVCRGAKPEKYDLIKNLALIFEMIVGRKRMASLYFNRDLSSLIKILPYNSRQTGIRIIRIMDYLYSSVYQNSGFIARERASGYYRKALIELSKIFSSNLYKRDTSDSLSRLRVHRDVDLLNSILFSEYVIRGSSGDKIDIPKEHKSEINQEIQRTLQKRHCYFPKESSWYN